MRHNFFTLRKTLFRRYHEGRGNLIVGDHSYGTPRVLAYGEGAILRIGKFCSIAGAVTVMLGGNHRTDWVSTYPFTSFPDKWPEAKEITGHPMTKGDVIIGNDVWVGFGATIMSGVRIGDGAVVGAMTVVTKDVSPYSIVAGNPAREVAKRFAEATIQALLELKWWDWPERAIRENISHLSSDNIDGFIATARKNAY